MYITCTINQKVIGKQTNRQTLHHILILNKFRYITSVLDERFRGTQKQE